VAKRDYYEVLEIDRGVDQASIKKAYRGLAMKYHPDRNPGDDHAAERMKEINEAYAVLSDAQKRQLYDAYGHSGLEGYTQEDILRNVDFSNIFRESGLGDIFGFGGTPFDGIFGRSSTRQKSSGKGADLRYDLTVTLEEVASGEEKTVAFTRESACPGCRGTGAEAGGLKGCDACRGSGQEVREHRSGFTVIRQVTTCSACSGNGSVVTESCGTCDGTATIEEDCEIKVGVPPGATDGHPVRVAGEGQRGPDLSGDLYVVLHVEDHPLFERRGDDILLRKDIAMIDAALGARMEVPSLNGGSHVDIPEGTQTGTVFQLKGKGIPHLDGYGTGDEYVVVNVVTPTDLSSGERRLLEGLRDIWAESGGDEDE
jgi:molecular chaperone DnaJ